LLRNDVGGVESVSRKAVQKEKAPSPEVD
jgi:hypothetical protein